MHCFHGTFKIIWLPFVAVCFTLHSHGAHFAESFECFKCEGRVDEQAENACAAGDTSQLSTPANVRTCVMDQAAISVGIGRLQCKSTVHNKSSATEPGYTGQPYYWIVRECWTQTAKDNRPVQCYNGYSGGISGWCFCEGETCNTQKISQIAPAVYRIIESLKTTTTSTTTTSRTSTTPTTTSLTTSTTIPKTTPTTISTTSPTTTSKTTSTTKSTTNSSTVSSTTTAIQKTTETTIDSSTIAKDMSTDGRTTVSGTTTTPKITVSSTVISINGFDIVGINGTASRVLSSSSYQFLALLPLVGVLILQ